MKKRIPYIISSLVLFSFCIIIVIFFRGNAIIRGFLGDAVIVMLMYSFLKSLKDFDSFKLSIVVIFFAYTIEFSQYFKVVTLLGFKETYLTRLIFGSVFDPMDLVAYTIGGIGIYYIDKYFLLAPICLKIPKCK